MWFAVVCYNPGDSMCQQRKGVCSFDHNNSHSGVGRAAMYSDVNTY